MMTESSSYSQLAIVTYMYICTSVVLRGQTAFFRFFGGGGKKGFVWFTVTTRLDTSEVSI